jgi:hypothetical protein
MIVGLRAGDPRCVGPYELLGRLGCGGMGSVFLSRPDTGSRVAVKVIRADLATDPEFRARFRREVTVARTVSSRFTALGGCPSPPPGLPDTGGGDLQIRSCWTGLDLAWTWLGPAGQLGVSGADLRQDGYPRGMPGVRLSCRSAKTCIICPGRAGCPVSPPRRVLLCHLLEPAVLVAVALDLQREGPGEPAAGLPRGSPAACRRP